MKKLSFLFAFYTFLSWILFFRDERALGILSTRFYPGLANFLTGTRETLLSFKLNTIPTLLFALFLIGAFVFYFRLIAKPVATKTAVIFAIVFQVIVFFSYPILSTDVLSYILSDRIATVYHQNVWTTRPDQYSSDPFYGLADWTNKTRIYGGVNQAIYSLATGKLGNDFLVNLTVHKLVVVAFVVATILIVAKIAPTFVPIVFANPLFVLETAGSGHNDILMLFFVVLSAWAFFAKKPLLVGLFLALATQVKITTLFLVVFLVIRFFADRKFSDLFKFGGVFAAAVAVIYVLMGVNPLYSVSRTAGSINVYWQSLPLVLASFVPYTRLVLTAGLAIFLGVMSLRALIFRTNPFLDTGVTLLIYLLFFVAAFWNWYPIWLLLLLPWAKDRRFTKYVLAYSFTAMLAYVVYWVGLRVNYQWGIWQVIMYLTILSGPAAVFVHEKFLVKIQD